MKIYTDDSKVHYVQTTVNADRTRDEIDFWLRAYDTIDIAWHWNPKENDVYVMFKIEEVIDGIPARVGVKVVMPTIWDKAIRNSPKPERRTERINLRVSMRAMLWYIKSHLETAYAMQSSRVAAFLPDMMTPNGGRYFDELKEHIDRYRAIEDHTERPQREVVVIPPKNVTNEVIDQ